MRRDHPLALQDRQHLGKQRTQLFLVLNPKPRRGAVVR
jgi:hypothetical protein